MAVRWFQFSLREWLALVVVVGLSIGLWQQHAQVRVLTVELARQKALVAMERATAKKYSLFARQVQAEGYWAYQRALRASGLEDSTSSVEPPPSTANTHAP